MHSNNTIIFRIIFVLPDPIIIIYNRKSDADNGDTTADRQTKGEMI